MPFRQIAVAAVVAWVAGECWSSAWDPVFWPRAHWTLLIGVFAILLGLNSRASTKSVATDLALLSIVASIGASVAWNLWMMQGWFPWDWVTWLASATKSDGEGAYRMVEYQFFLLIFVAASFAWFGGLRRRLTAC